MFFRWRCKNWHVAKLLHQIPTHVNSLRLPRRKYVCCEHQWQRLTTVPTEEQTRQWEIGGSTLCSVALPTHRRLGNAGGKRLFSKFFQCLMSYTKQGQGMSNVSQRRKVLIHRYLLAVPRGSSAGLPKLLYLSRLSWKHLSLYHYFMQSVTTENRVLTVCYKSCLNRDLTNSHVLILADYLVDFWEPVNMSFFWPHSRIYHW